MDFHGFRGMGAYSLKERPAAPIETFARFQAGFLSSEEFHRISVIFIDFHRFWWIFMYFGVWMLKLLKRQPAAPIETFARFQAGFLSSEDFHRFPSIFIDVHRF